MHTKLSGAADVLVNILLIINCKRMKQLFESCTPKIDVDTSVAYKNPQIIDHMVVNALE